MKSFAAIGLCMMLVAVLSVPALAKVNLSGAMWTTFWAQQEGLVNAQTAAGGTWVDGPAVGTSDALAAGFGNAPGAAKKTFLLGNNMLGNGVQAKATNGNGLMLAADCPVNDWVKAYGEFNVLNGGNLALNEAWIDLAFMREFSVRAGRMQVPFGYDRTVRPGIGVDEVFVSEYTQQANGALLGRQDNGVQAYGEVLSGLLAYNLFLGNGAISTVADSGGMVAAAQASPDIDDAKQLGLNLQYRPFTGAYVGGSYFAGDYTNTNPSVTGSRSRFSAYDLNAGYEHNGLFLVSAEYATTRHDKLTADYALGVMPAASGVEEARVNEYILKAIYSGLADWEFGVRYGVIDPKSIEAEQLAGFSAERKVSFAAGYRFARAAFLKAEYSWLDTDFKNYDKIANVAGRVRQNPAQDIDDDIFALSLGLQF